MAKKVKIQSTTSDPVHMFELQVLSSGNNAALEGTPSQSSTFRNADKFAASKANDGNNSTFCHTDPASNSWWEVELNESVEVDSITIFNRYCGADSADPSGCLCRLSNAFVELYDETDSLVASSSLEDMCSQVFITKVFSQCESVTPSPTVSSSPSQSPVTSSDAVSAKRVKIQSMSSDPVHMFEVQVLSNGNDVALEGTSSQSSTFRNADKFAASQANDGKNSTFCHTDAKPNSWWEIELKESVEVENIVILNRWCQSEDDPSDCLCRLSHSTIILFDENDSIVSTQEIDDTCKQGIIVASLAASVSTTSSYTVRLESTTGEQLHFFELQAFSGGVNVAFEGLATQSSTFKNKDKFAANNAIDSDTTTFIHTDDPNPWWEVELQAVAVESITIFNRWCRDESDSYSCLCRLSSARIIVIQDGAVVATKTLGDTCNQLILSESFIENV